MADLSRATVFAIICNILQKIKYNSERFKNHYHFFLIGNVVPGLVGYFLKAHKNHEEMHENQPADELSIVTASTDDIKVIRRLAEEIWPHTYEGILTEPQINYMMNLFYSEESLQDQFQHHQFILGKFGNEPVAFASFGASGEENVFKLHKIYLSPAHQGKGMGRKMIDHVIDIVRLQASALDLNVNRQNPALGFYQKLGFEILRLEDNDIGKGYWMNDYVLRRKI